MIQTTNQQRFGHTLIELIAALIAAGVLMVGLGSVMMIARQIALTPSASVRRIEAAQVVNELADELRHATFVVEHTSTTLEFVVADRNGEGTQERIRYSWSGDEGDPLFKSINGGDDVQVADSVRDFSIELTMRDETTSFETTTNTSTESLLQIVSYSGSQLTKDITSNDCYAQQIDPTSFMVATPTGATHWNLTRVEFLAKKEGSETELLYVQLRLAGDPNDTPTSIIAGQVTIDESDLGNILTWETANFTEDASGLSLHRPYALVWAGNSGDKAAKLVTDTNASSGVLVTDNGGATWTYDASRQIYYRLYGTFAIPDTPVDVTRTYVSSAKVTLRMSDLDHSRIESSVPLLNSPELVATYWRADFESDPTVSDSDGDGQSDWKMADDSDFDTDTLTGGVWQPDGELESKALDDYAPLTTVEMRWQTLPPTGSQVSLVMDAERADSGGLDAPLTATLTMQSDGTQLLQVYGLSKSNDATWTLLNKLMPAGFVNLRVTILPDDDLVCLAVNGVDEGVYEFPMAPHATSTPFVHVTSSTSGTVAGEIDYVEVRVSTSE